MMSHRLAAIDRAERLVVEREELLVLGVLVPVRLVERRGREHARRHLGQVVASAPEVHREHPLQVLVAVERAAGEVLHVDGDAGALRVLREHLCCLHHARRGSGRVEVDLQPLLTRLLEQELGAVEILVVLREPAARVAGVERRVDVVTDDPVARQRLLHHLLAVGDQLERLPDTVVLEGGGVDPHVERQPPAGRRLVDLEVAAALDHGDLGDRKVDQGVDLTAEQRVHPRRVVAEVDDHHLVEVRLPRAPVVLVADVHALPAGREALHLERSGADEAEGALAHRVRAVPVRDDALEVLGHRIDQRHVGSLQRQPYGAVVELADAVGVDGAHGGLPEQAQLRAHGAPEGEGHVVGIEGLAVVELDPLSHADRPHVRLVVRDLLGETERRLVLVVEVSEPFERGHVPGDVRLGDDVLAVDEVRGASTRDSDPEPAAPLWCCERRRLGEGGQPSRCQHCSAERGSTEKLLAAQPPQGAFVDIRHGALLRRFLVRVDDQPAVASSGDGDDVRAVLFT